MSNLDMSLDDIIKMNKKSGGGGTNSRGRARGSGGLGPARRTFKRSTNRAIPYAAAKVQAPESTWDHDMFAEQAVVFQPRVNQVSAIETGTKLYISNLDYGVSNEDIKELFVEVGYVKRYTIHYDRSGRSKGTAEVVFSCRNDAEAAFKMYNNVELDGKPMKIEIVGTNIATPSAVPQAANGIYGNQNVVARSQVRRGGVTSRRGGGGRGARRGQGRGRGDAEKVSAEDLDADLDKYHAEAMQTN